MTWDESRECRTATPALPALIDGLRAATRSEHDATEAMLDVLGGTRSLDQYRHVIEQLYGYYEPLERALQLAHAAFAGDVAPPYQSRTALLAQDLQALGDGRAGRDGRNDRAFCAQLPVLDSLAAVLGCRYVLEGASLGGRVIARHAMARLAVTAERGCAFFSGNQEHTRVRWEAYLHVLRVFGDAHPLAHADAILAAIATFRTLRTWWGRAAT